MAYTSEQYKYLLLKRLQRNFSMKSIADRNYTYTFFGKLFDDTIVVTEEAYNMFVKAMDDELDYCAVNNIHACEKINVNDVESHSVVLVNAFAAIGITLVISTEEDENHNYTTTFTKPNGDVMVYAVSNDMNMTNYFYINARAGTEYTYTKVSAPYYNLEKMEVLQLSDCNIYVCGVGCYWQYDADTYTLTITGDGSYTAPRRDEQIGGVGDFTTLILGSNVSELPAGSLDTTGLATIVLLHAADFPLIINAAAANRKNAHTWDVYTDNTAFREHTWGKNDVITWHTLDEWEG